MVRQLTLDQPIRGSNPLSPATRVGRCAPCDWPGTPCLDRGAMRPSRCAGGAGSAHSPLGAMNRAGSPFGELGETGFSRSDLLIQCQSIERFESSLPSQSPVAALLRLAGDHCVFTEGRCAPLRHRQSRRRHSPLGALAPARRWRAGETGFSRSDLLIQCQPIRGSNPLPSHAAKLGLPLSVPQRSGGWLSGTVHRPCKVRSLRVGQRRLTSSWSPALSSLPSATTLYGVVP